MRLELSRSAATAGLLAALTARTFYGLALDAPEVMNAAWLAAPLGVLLALPVVWLMARGRSRLMSALLLPALALDAAATIEWTAFSESCLAFDHTSPVLLMLPLLLAVTRCTWLGGDAVGGAARVWARLFILLMTILTLCQMTYYKTCWLAPWLGNGAGSILRVGLRAAGWTAVLCGAAIESCKEPLSFRDALPCILIASSLAALMLALSRMMSPAAMDGAVSRQTRLDALLTNGRAPLVLQLPMIVAWFAGMLHLMAFEAVAACALLKRATGAGEGICIVLGLVVVSTLTLLRVTNLVRIDLYPVIAIIAIMKEVRRKCAASA